MCEGCQLIAKDRFSTSSLMQAERAVHNKEDCGDDL
jgi:hypothetical protein